MAAVEAAAISFAHGAPEMHTLEYLGDTPIEYMRIELRTEQEATGRRAMPARRL